MSVSVLASIALAVSQLTITEKAGHISEAVVVVDASPAEIYDYVTTYENWTLMFSDVTWATVKTPGTVNARVRFHSRALGQTVTIAFNNIPDRLIQFRGIDGPPGGRAAGTYELVALPDGRTQVTARLYMDVLGVTGVFVSSAKIRRMRAQKLRSDMTDVMRHFPPRQISEVHA
jgi:hypothetical protein